MEAGRTATVVIVAFVAVLLTLGCAPERPPGPPSGGVIVAAGDIADCATEGDEATARLVGGIDATVLSFTDSGASQCHLASSRATGQGTPPTGSDR